MTSFFPSPPAGTLKMYQRLLRLIYKVGSSPWLFLSGLLLSQGITMVDAVTLGSSWPKFGTRTLVEGLGFLLLSASCAALSWETQRVEGEVAVIAHVGVRGTQHPESPAQHPRLESTVGTPAGSGKRHSVPDGVLSHYSRRMRWRILMFSLSLVIVLAGYLVPVR